jgi:hypothetical protein
MQENIAEIAAVASHGSAAWRWFGPGGHESGHLPSCTQIPPPSFLTLAAPPEVNAGSLGSGPMILTLAQEM